MLYFCNPFLEIQKKMKKKKKVLKNVVQGELLNNEN